VASLFFGSALRDTPIEFQEDALFALELMKFGVLTGELLDAPPDRPFPENIAIMKQDNVDHRSAVLLSRVMSLVPMHLKDMEFWEAEVDFDLAAFHSIVKIVKRSLRQLTEASLAHILLQDMSRMKLVPKDHWCPDKPKIPSFMLPRNCMGLVVKYFLNYQIGSPSQFVKEQDGERDRTGSGRASLTSEEESKTTIPIQKDLSDVSSIVDGFEHDLQRKFACCKSPIADLEMGFNFWAELLRIIHRLSACIDTDQLTDDMTEATSVLCQKMRSLRFDEHPMFQEVYKKLRGEQGVAGIKHDASTIAS